MAQVDVSWQLGRCFQVPMQSIYPAMGEQLITTLTSCRGVTALTDTADRTVVHLCAHACVYRGVGWGFMCIAVAARSNTWRAFDVSHTISSIIY